MTTGVRTAVRVNTFTRSVTFVTNEAMRLLLEIHKGRGLAADEITQNRQFFETGISAWLTDRSLERLHLEVYREGDGVIIERWDVAFDYLPNPKEDVEELPTQKIAEAMRVLDKLPANARVRVVVSTKPGAVQVPGWESTALRTGTGSEREIGGFGYGELGARVLYLGGTGGKKPGWWPFGRGAK